MDARPGWEQQEETLKREWDETFNKRNDDMPNLNDMKTSNSRFLTQADVGKGILVTVSGIEQGNVAAEGAPPETKWIASFKEQEKAMVLNNTNLDLMAWACGSENSDEWTGKHVVIYTDPSVMYGGRRVGGLRIRPPKEGAKLPEPEFNDALPPIDNDDGIPF